MLLFSKMLICLLACILCSYCQAGTHGCFLWNFINYCETRFHLQESCLPPSVPDRGQKLQFTFGCRVILPPESFLSLRLPFVYGVQLEDGSLQSLRPFEYQPEVTAWIAKGTTLQVISKGSTMFDGSSEN